MRNYACRSLRRPLSIVTCLLIFSSGAPVQAQSVNEELSKTLEKQSDAKRSFNKAHNPAKKGVKRQKAPKRILSASLIRERFSFGFGSFYSSGDYGLIDEDGNEKSTEIFSIPLRASYSRQDWRFSAQIPYLHISGPASVIAISDGAEVLEKVAEGERQRWGNGDLRLSGQYQWYRSTPRKYGSHIGTSIKLPVASKKADLGTGEFDYSLYLGGFLRSGSWINNGRIGYQVMGDTDETDYNNRLYLSLGTHYLIDREYSAGFNAHYKQAAVDSGDSISTLSASINKKMAGGWRVGLSFGTGLTDASADYFGGVQFTKSFVRKRRVLKD